MNINIGKEGRKVRLAKGETDKINAVHDLLRQIENFGDGDAYEARIGLGNFIERIDDKGNLAEYTAPAKKTEPGKDAK